MANDATTSAVFNEADSEADLPQPPVPKQIGRYRIERVLGKGGFGVVYLARDEQLKRPVAVKVPLRRRSSQPQDTSAYLAEARTAAELDHPNIVPVYDVGSTEDFPCFIVSKYIQGFSLSERIKVDRPSAAEAAELVATVAEALHHAHRKRLVHRDIKPGNILIDTSGAPLVVDFGLASKEGNIDSGLRCGGTPAYMSPEQASGEGHRVDGRSDIFSLGVVFYELLSGSRPFSADSQPDVLAQVRFLEPRPPRQLDHGIPKELERICLKALAKRASERYSTAHDLAEDLRHWLGEQDIATSKPASTDVALRTGLDQPPLQVVAVIKDESGMAATPSTAAPVETPSSHSSRLHIVPKGLRSFDSHDADFFLDLLPGPRDRDGFPDSVRFWKTRIEEADADSTFAVGLIYGPSGCGKSSLVKAGLLPRLTSDVIAVYVEATAQETESRLLNGLRKRCPALPASADLVKALGALRRGLGSPAGKKVLIVLDQFEQWLHAKKEEQNPELVHALRQCDGSRVQCIVMVRDDFWMAATRFMRELEIRLVEGQNSAAVDLFDPDHARKVLAAFGRAFGRLPETSSEMGGHAKEFLTSATSGLTREGKVISVRLALFAEMMKGRSWTPASLKEVGGTAGVGVTFLEETFSAATAPPEHRYHQKAARAVLASLLPESRTDIRGHMRSRAELLEASGYASRAGDFDDLIHILDGEVRLLTPTDPEGKDGAGGTDGTPHQTGHQYYQLTHDYLVPALRDWLTRKQRETRRGRAELLLADRADAWNARPENRQLPSFRQWLSIRFMTRKRVWTLPQAKMMDKATRFHVTRVAAVALLFVAAIVELALRERAARQQKATHAAELVRNLIDADTAQVPAISVELAGFRQWADPLLRRENSLAGPESRQKLRTSLALLAVDPGQAEFLYSRLLAAEPSEVPMIRDALLPYRQVLDEKLWATVRMPKSGIEAQRLRAAAALAKYDPDDPKWDLYVPSVLNDLFRENTVFFGQWTETFRPIKDRLIPTLNSIFRDPGPEHSSERTLAASLLANYLGADPHSLAELLLDSDEKQFPPIFAKLQAHPVTELPELPAEIDRVISADSRDEEKERLAKRQVNAAVALLLLSDPSKAWSMLRQSPDPRARSYLIHRIAPAGVDPALIVRQLNVEPDTSIRRALILSLGEVDQKQWKPSDQLMEKLLALYEKEPDPGLHAATEWLLRHWGQEERIKVIDARLRTPEEQLQNTLRSRTTDEQRKRLAHLSEAISRMKLQLGDAEKDLPARQAAWEQDVLKGPVRQATDLAEGLIAYYPLDETEGNETASGLAGQPAGMYGGAGMPRWAPGVIGRALALDGRGWLVVNKPLDLDCDQPFSYGCWLQHTADPPMGLISTRIGNGTGGFDLRLEDAHQLRVQISGENDIGGTGHAIKVITTTGIEPMHSPGWHHVMVTYDGSRRAAGVRVYIDGRPQPTQPFGDNIVGTMKTAHPLYIGCGGPSGSFRLKGEIDDVRIYSRRLDDVDVARLYESGVESIVGVAPVDRTPEQRRALADCYRGRDEPMLRASSDISKARAELRNMARDLTPPRWYVNAQGQAIVVIPGPVEFEMGSPSTETDRESDEPKHDRRIERTFAVAAKPVTVEQYSRFDASYPKLNSPLPAAFSRSPDLPAVEISWHEAASYCNWLSRQEGIAEDQLCYEIADGGVTKLKTEYLRLDGYRLPTEAEIEYATRAGAVTSRFYGETSDLLPKYARYADNSEYKTWPVGSLKPNDLGFFDIHGNVFCWTDTPYSVYDALTDNAGSRDVLATDTLVTRGGSYKYSAQTIRSALRLHGFPGYRFDDCGFRPARTMLLKDFASLTLDAASDASGHDAGERTDSVTNEDPVEMELRVMLAARRNASTAAHTRPSTMFWFNYNGEPHLWAQTDATHWEEAYPDGHTTSFLIEGGERAGTLLRRVPGNGFEVLIPPIEDDQPLLCRSKATEPWQNLGPIHLVR